VDLTRRDATRLLAATALTSSLGAQASPGTSGRAGATTRAPDVAVIGAGAFGAWTAHALRAAGASVCLVDAYGAANSRASSGGESRIIRSSYGAQAIYSRMARDSLAHWRELERRSGARLYEPTGVLAIAPDGDDYLDLSARTLATLGIRHERLDAAETMRRYPQFHLADSESALYEPDSGALYARRAIQELVRLLVADGMSYRQEAIAPPAGGGRQADVRTRAGERLVAGHYVYACGPWLPKLFAALLGGRIRVDRAEVYFLGVPAGDSRYLPSRMPTWLDEYAPGGAYGFASLEGRGVKVAVDARVEPMDPDDGDRTVTAPYLADLRRFLRHRFPGLAEAPIVETRVCQYEMATGENYILDAHPDYDNVWIAGGGSGHGYKNAPMVGGYVADLIDKRGPAEDAFRLRPGTG